MIRNALKVKTVACLCVCLWFAPWGRADLMEEIIEEWIQQKALQDIDKYVQQKALQRGWKVLEKDEDWENKKRWLLKSLVEVSQESTVLVDLSQEFTVDELVKLSMKDLVLKASGQIDVSVNDDKKVLFQKALSKKLWKNQSIVLDPWDILEGITYDGKYCDYGFLAQIACDKILLVYQSWVEKINQWITFCQEDISKITEKEKRLAKWEEKKMNDLLEKIVGLRGIIRFLGGKMEKEFKRLSESGDVECVGKEFRSELDSEIKTVKEEIIETGLLKEEKKEEIPPLDWSKIKVRYVGPYKPEKPQEEQEKLKAKEIGKQEDFKDSYVNFQPKPSGRMRRTKKAMDDIKKDSEQSKTEDTKAGS